jgi:hypothetical protein
MKLKIISGSNFLGARKDTRAMLDAVGKRKNESHFQRPEPEAHFIASLFTD